MRHTHVHVAGVDLKADVFGALFHEAERVLLVADLHLEKGSSFARRGMMLPPYDTAATLAKLAAVVGRYRPRQVVALGAGDWANNPAAGSTTQAPARVKID